MKGMYRDQAGPGALTSAAEEWPDARHEPGSANRRLDEPIESD